MAGGFSEERGVVEVAGPDAREFLQRLVTNDVAALPAGQARFAALLSPQGKILVDFLLVAAPDPDGGDRFLLDCPASLASDLARKLTLYRLRAKVTVADRSAEWAAAPIQSDEAAGLLTYRDPRRPDAGHRAIGPKAELMPVVDPDFRNRRVDADLPAGGFDYPYGDTFPHEANLDRLAGVDFTKGCYVGQEVVSRMQHRGSTRKRVTPFTWDGGSPEPGAEIHAGDLPVGTVGSIGHERGLALVRLDRVADAVAAGIPLLAGEVPVRIDMSDSHTADPQR